MHDTCRVCGTDFELHMYHWCHQVCPACLQPHWRRADGTMYRDGYFDPKTREAIRENVNRNGGRYLPTFR